MRRIVECLLQEGIDESMIHRVLDLIEEEYEVVDETSDEKVADLLAGREANFNASGNRSDSLKLDAARLAAGLRERRKPDPENPGKVKIELPGNTKEEKNFYKVKRDAVKANNVVLRGQAAREENKEKGVKNPEFLKKRIADSTKKSSQLRKRMHTALEKIPGLDLPTKYRKYVMNWSDDKINNNK